VNAFPSTALTGTPCAEIGASQVFVAVSVGSSASQDPFLLMSAHAVIVSVPAFAPE